MKVPVFINSFNRLTWLREMVDELQRFEGVESINVVDNDSSYPPLVWYLEHLSKREAKEGELPIYTCMLEQNNGPRSAYDVAKVYAKNQGLAYVCVVDPDLDLRGLPSDFILRCVAALASHKDVNKVGASLRIDDIPENAVLRDEILSYEEVYWKIKRDEDWYEADIDTTFLVERTETGFSYGPALRSAKFSARHLPWYITRETLTAEDVFYFRNLDKVHKPGIYWSTLFSDGRLERQNSLQEN